MDVAFATMRPSSSTTSASTNAARAPPESTHAVHVSTEPIFAGLNIGGGIVLFPFPLGEAARLGYNSAVTPWFIPEIPNVKEMRDLFQILAAKEKHPELSSKPIKYLDKSDMAKLEQSARQLVEAGPKKLAILIFYFAPRSPRSEP